MLPMPIKPRRVFSLLSEFIPLSFLLILALDLGGITACNSTLLQAQPSVLTSHYALVHSAMKTDQHRCGLSKAKGIQRLIKRLKVPLMLRLSPFLQRSKGQQYRER